MRLSSSKRSVSATAIVIGTIAAGSLRAEAGGFTQTNLVSDIPGLATITDPNLKNPWGISDLGGSPLWISNQGTNTSTLYPVAGVAGVSASPFVVSTGGGPTGQVSNPNGSAFHLGSGGASLFIFANLNGTITAWGPSLGTSGPAGPPEAVPAEVVSTTPGAAFTGLAASSAHDSLFALDVAGGQINKFDDTFTRVVLPVSAFAAPANIQAAGLRPFNVEDIGGHVLVTYAPPTRAGQAAAVAGEGAVAVFDETGALQSEILGGPLASPWGIAAAPAGLARFGGDWFIGNESASDSGIQIYDPTTKLFVGSIAIDPGAGNGAGALWGLTFGFGQNGGDPNALYFVDGINGESDGLFGAFTVAVPETSTWAMILGGFAALAFVARRRSLRGRALLA